MQMLRRWDNNCAHDDDLENLLPPKLLKGEYLGFSNVSLLFPPILFHATFFG